MTVAATLPEQQPRHPPTTARAHDDQVRSLADRRLDDRLGRGALHRQRSDIQPFVNSSETRSRSLFSATVRTAASVS